MPDTGLLGIKIVGAVLLALFALVLGRKFYNRSRVEHQTIETHDEFQSRLFKPDFDVFQKTFGVVPEDIRALYDNPELLIKKNFYFTGRDEFFISTFLPADKEMLESSRVDSPKAIPFAQAKEGDFYIAMINPLNPHECAVYFAAGNQKPEQKISESLARFISRPTRPAR
jgi:hypothetical protein